MAGLSPMMQQYFEIKKKHPDKLLFFRLGDFYEMFFDDAILASKELELTLTGRDCGQAERAPMCGVPFHSYESYVAKLIAKGYKVAICEQLENPAQAKGIVKRDVVRVMTPGTVIESSMLQDDRNNYIASVFICQNRVGLCFADVSTGTADITCLEGKNLELALIAELARYAPSEVLFNEQILPWKQAASYLKNQLACAAELLESERYEPARCEAVLKRQFGENFSEHMKLEAADPAAIALAVLIEYLNETQKKGVERLKTVEYYAKAEYMQLSPTARMHLELTQTMRGREKRGTLLWVLEHTQTAMGKRLLRAWLERPLMDAKQINLRLDAVEELVGQTMMREDLSALLERVYDLERLLTRTVYGSLSPRELYALAQTCEQLPEIKQTMHTAQSRLLQTLFGELDEMADLKDLIFSALAQDPPAAVKDGNVIRAGYNAEVDELRDIVHGGKGFLGAMEARLKEETGIRTLKIGYNRVFGYYIEVSKSFSNQVPEGFIRKQTLANAERYITEELKQLENKILGANERLAALERELFDGLLQAAAAEAARIQRTAVALAQLDVLTGLAAVAVKNEYVRPDISEDDTIEIIEGRHPVIEQMLKGTLFVPNDTLLNGTDDRLCLITGPNMAGKSTFMRQTALIVLMAQIGSFVPAKRCRVGVVDAIFTRVGASDDLASGQSTFMVEMTEVADILRNATKRSLVILDEIGRGTSTFDGMSIARAVAEHIASDRSGMGCKTLFATHYHELTDLEGKVEGVKNYNIAVKKRGEDVIFLRRIVRGPADDSYGIEVAKLAGLPDAVTKRAREILNVLEQGAPAAAQEEHVQLSWNEMGSSAVNGAQQALLDKLAALDVETLTPLEALTYLYDCKQELMSARRSAQSNG